MFRRESPHLPLLKVLLAALLLVLILDSTPWDTYVMLGLGALLVGAVVLGVAAMLVSYGGVLYRRWHAPMREVPAVVLRKWTRTYELNLPPALPLLGRAGFLANFVLTLFRGRGEGPDPNAYTQWVFWVSFQVGELELEFSVPESVYVNLEEDAEGMLSYRADRFLNFRHTRDWEKAPDGYEIPGAKSPGPAGDA
jgi:hypothetical protein